MRVFENTDELWAWVGWEVACSDWLVLEEDHVKDFADLVSGRHLVPEEHKRDFQELSYSSHAPENGYLVMSMVPQMMASCLRVEGVAAMSCELVSVRMAAPVAVGQRIRGRLLLERLNRIAEGATQAYWNVEVEIEHGKKPACVVRNKIRYYPNAMAQPETV